MTYKQIHICIEAIDRRKYNNQVFLARLQGNEAEYLEKKIEETPEQKELSAEQDELINKLAEKAMQRKRDSFNG